MLYSVYDFNNNNNYYYYYYKGGVNQARQDKEQEAQLTQRNSASGNIVQHTWKGSFKVIQGYRCR